MRSNVLAFALLVASSVLLFPSLNYAATASRSFESGGPPAAVQNDRRRLRRVRRRERRIERRMERRMERRHRRRVRRMFRVNGRRVYRWVWIP